MSGRRAVSVVEVADPAMWAQLAARGMTDAHVETVLDAHRRVVTPAFERDVLPGLGADALVRLPRRVHDPRALADLGQTVARLSARARAVLHAAQRHALDGVVLGRQAWDPEADADAVRALHGAGLLVPLPADDAPYAGRYRVDPDLPAPPAVPYAFDEAVMDETDDLSPPGPGPVALLHDMASLAAALESVQPRVTQPGTVAVADGKRIGARLADADLAADGRLETHPRWARALRGLHALAAVALDPITRTWHLDLGLEHTLAGDEDEATDRLVHRLIERDLHVVVPAVRAAVREAGDGAVDEVVFLDLLRVQHRDLIFPAWVRDGARVYPDLGASTRLPYDDTGWDRVEAPMIQAALHKMVRFGLIRRAPGVFAATDDGRRWASVSDGPRPPVWVTGDLELIVPPGGVTPWERFQLERLGRCVQRDTVDRYRIERDALRTWLSTHDVDEALALLARRCPGVPSTVVETLRAWAADALQVVLWRGVVLPAQTASGSPQRASSTD